MCRYYAVKIFFIFKKVAYDRLKRFRHYPPAPERASKTIPQLVSTGPFISVYHRYITDHMIITLKCYTPIICSSILITGYPVFQQRLTHRNICMHRPCHKSIHFRIGCPVFIHILCIFYHESTEYQTFCFNCFCSRSIHPSPPISRISSIPHSTSPVSLNPTDSYKCLAALLPGATPVYISTAPNLSHTYCRPSLSACLP